MKMGAGLFWGLILIAIGLSIILKVLFDISAFRVVLAIVFVLIGIKILIGKPLIHHEKDDNVIMFGERNYKHVPMHNKEYNTIFGKTVYDFREVKSLDELHTFLTFNTIFGSTEIYLPDSIPVRIKTDAVFSGAVMPNGNTIAFGTSKYSSSDVMENAQLLEIEAHVVFGGLNIKRK
jgi:hypothetical protein